MSWLRLHVYLLPVTADYKLISVTVFHHLGVGQRLF